MKQTGRVRHPLTAFYIETLLMIIVFVGIILCITQVFGKSRTRSRDARLLTDAVCLAQNTAEAFSASETPEQLVELLTGDAQEAGMEDTAEGKVELTAQGTGLTGRFGADMKPAAGGELLLQMDWQGREDGLVYARITVYEGENPVYTLDTASSGKEGW